MSSSFKVFVVGHTGLVGKQFLDLIAEDSRFREIVLFGRRLVDLNYGENNNKIDQKLIDFDKLSEHGELFRDNFDGGFCCLGTTRSRSGKEGFIKVDYNYTLKVAELARQGNCKQFHLISTGAGNPKSCLLYLQVKGKVAEAICRLKFPKLSIYQPGVLSGQRAENRLVESALKTVLKPISYFRPTWLTTPVEVLARAMVNNFVDGLPNVESITEENNVKILDNNQIFQLGSPK